MPVITRIMTEASGSRRSVSGICSVPEPIQLKSVSLMARTPPSAGAFNRSRTASTDTMKEKSIAPVASRPETALGRRRPIAALTTKPSNGNNGIRYSTRSPLERCERVRREYFLVPEHGDHDSEAHRRFGGGHRHHEEHDDLAVDLAAEAVDGHKRQVDGIQHDLDGQQNRDDVAPQEHARGADGK